MGLLADQLDQRCGAQFLGHDPGGGLVDPHQRRVQHQPGLQPQVQGDLKRLDGVVAAIGIARIVSLADARDDVLDAAAIGQRRSKGQEDQIAPRHEGRGQPGLGHDDLGVAGQRGLRDLFQRGDVQHRVLAQSGRPVWETLGEGIEEDRALSHLDPVALAIVEAQSLDLAEPRAGPGQAGGAVLPAGEEDKRRLHHPSRLGSIRPSRSPPAMWKWKCGTSWRPSGPVLAMIR
jgi:hypothetical protein